MAQCKNTHFLKNNHTELSFSKTKKVFGKKGNNERLGRNSVCMAKIPTQLQILKRE